MAFNLSLKALFSKLKPAARAVAPVADDIAKGVANYGDDAAKLAANYGDDALRAVDKVDDALAGFDLTVPTAQQRLKDELLFKRSPASLDVSEVVELPSVVPDRYPRFDSAASRLAHYNEPGGAWGRFPKTTRYLGDVAGDIGLGKLVPGDIGETIRVPELPTSGLVVQGPTLELFEAPIGLRPHKNTALGRWFSKNNPNFSIRNLDVSEDIF